MLGVAEDQPGAGAEDRPAGLVVGANRRLQTGRLDALDDRRALTAGNDQAIEAIDIAWSTNLARLGAKLAQRPCVRLEIALDR
jgi:hypothetical protein